MSDLQAGIDRVIGAALRAGARAAEVYIVESVSVSVHYFAGGRVRASTDKLLKVGVAAEVEGGRVGVAGGVVASLDDAAALAEEAVSVARAVKPLEGWQGFNPNLSKASVRVVDERVREFGVAEAVELAKRLASAIEDTGVRAAESGVDSAYGRVVLANTESSRVVGYEYSLFLAHVDADAGEGSVYGDWVALRRLDVEAALRMAENAARRARDVGRASVIESGVYNVILTPKVAADLLAYALAPAFSGEAIIKNRSPLAGRLGDAVLSTEVTIIDDPLLDMEYGSRPFDDEGVSSTRKVLVEGGVLKAYLNTRMTSARLGGEPGNAERRAPWSLPSPAPSNLVVEHAHPLRSLDELASEAGRGLLVDSTIGAWLSDPVSGKASMTVTLGYKVERGEIAGPVKGIVVSGNIYDMLGDVAAAGDVECWFGVCTRYLMVRASVAGK